MRRVSDKHIVKILRSKPISRFKYNYLQFILDKSFNRVPAKVYD